MGMAASQARFLGLTARQNNVEFEGQQINQQRTLLSNESANYYNDLLGMTVPIPPSVDSYTKTVYTFNDGALDNTVTSMIAQSNGMYTVSYLSKWQDDYTPVSAATSVVTRTGTAGTYEYSIGAAKLRKLGTTGGGSSVGNQINIAGQIYEVKQDGNGYYIETSSMKLNTRPCTQEEIDNIEYYYFSEDLSSAQQAYKDELTGAFYTMNGDERTELTGVTEDDLIMSLYNEGFDNPEYAISLVQKNENGEYIREEYQEETSKEYLTAAQIASITTYDTVADDNYLGSMSSAEIANAMKEEAAWANLLEQKYGSKDWYVRYVTDTTTGIQKPNFYEAESLESAVYDSKTKVSLSCINCYTIGSEQKISEFKGVENCKIEKDASGRLISINIPKDVNGTTVYTEYALTTQTATDQDAYNDAMNQYEYDKNLYDQAVENINSKIEIIQAEDKNLELRLKQLDTEQKAISTEKEAVSKVIEKNTSDTFKTFSA